MPETTIGIVLFYLPAKGYGYVRVPDTHEEFRFRTTDLLQVVQAGDRVRFTIKHEKKEYRATAITLLTLA